MTQKKLFSIVRAIWPERQSFPDSALAWEALEVRAVLKGGELHDRSQARKLRILELAKEKGGGE